MDQIFKLLSLAFQVALLFLEDHFLKKKREREAQELHDKKKAELEEKITLHVRVMLTRAGQESEEAQELEEERERSQREGGEP